MNAEWDAAVGQTEYPWGDYFPPRSDDGNYAFFEDGKEDPQKVGVDGIQGTAPVGSFKPNALGFYDLGGNVAEWMWDEWDKKRQTGVYRGGSWRSSDKGWCRAAPRYSPDAGTSGAVMGLRLALAPSK
jgi:formylglycine-generating enzyme required for sulfatase activity